MTDQSIHDTSVDQIRRSLTADTAPISAPWGSPIGAITHVINSPRATLTDLVLCVAWCDCRKTRHQDEDAMVPQWVFALTDECRAALRTAMARNLGR